MSQFLKSQMNDLIGIQVDGIPYKDLDLVGVLLFAVFPSTIVYKNDQDRPIIKEWVDCSEDNLIDRYFYYSVDKRHLKSFLDKEISHLDLINRADDGMIFFQDIQKDKDPETITVSLAEIPINYLPQGDFLFDFEDGVDTFDIIEAFDLDAEEKAAREALRQAKERAKQEHSETLYVRMLNGKNVDDSAIKTNALGGILVSFDKFYNSVGLDYFKKKTRGDISIESESHKKLREQIETEVYEDIRASYGILIRPVKSRIDEIDHTPSAIIAERVIQLITNSKKDEQYLKTEYQLHSRFTIAHYREFLEQVYKREMDIEFNWINPLKDEEIQTSINFRSANKVMVNIDNLNIVTTEPINVTGKFRAMDCATGYFVFISVNNEKYTGHFDKNTKEGMSERTFTQVYDIVINRQVEKKPGKKEKIIDTITSCILS